MVDYSTVLIAAISAGAGLAGSIIAGHFNLKGLGMSHSREDAASVRAKAEELYAELDRIQDLSNVTSAKALAAISAKEHILEQIPTINLGKVRALFGLYFSKCLPAIVTYDNRSVENIKTLRADLEEKKMDSLTAGLGYVIVDCQTLVTMCREARTLLDAQADALGRSMRDSISE